MNFKRYKYLILSVAAAFSFSSCLDENPLYTQNNEIVFSTEDNAELALMGCYAYFASVNTYGQMMQEMTTGYGGFTWGQRNGSDQDVLCSINMPPSQGTVGTLWDGQYKVISESNAFIENMQNSGLSEETKTQYIGEAKFLRALAYYNLTTLFGEVPLKTVASTSEGIATPRSTREEIFQQIVSDLTDALAISESHTDGRASRWTVKAYLGKVYHRMYLYGINATESLNNAQSYFDDVYSNGPFALEPNFNDLFGEWVTGSKESIFQVNFIADASRGYYNRGSNRMCPQSSTSGVNWTTYAFSYSAYDLHEGTYPGDPRIKTTFLTQWRSRNGNNQANPKPQVGTELTANDSTYAYPYVTYTVAGDSIYNAQGKGVELKRYVAKIPFEQMADPKNPSLEYLANLPYPENATAQDSARINALRNVEKTFPLGHAQTRMPSFGKVYDQNQAAQAAHKNLMVYRYAEMLLLMADVYNELGQTSRAIELTNEVLARARMSNGGTLTGQPADWNSSLSQDEVRKKLYYERIFELWSEPDVFDMTRMRGTEYLSEFLTYHNENEKTIASDTDYQTSANNVSERRYNGGNLTQDYLTKILLFPIPNSEMDANPAITENNPGY